MKKVLLIIVIISVLLANSISSPRANQSETNLSTEVIEALDTIEDDEKLIVYVILSDVDYTAVMEEFESLYPDQHDIYVLAKESDIAEEIRQAVNANIDKKDEGIEYEDPLDGVLLQQAIETKRSLFAEAYYEQNSMFADAHVSKDDQVFISEYSPMLILSMTKTQILHLDDEDNVVRVELFIEYDISDELEKANKISHAEYVRDTCGNKGNGVKIGQIESGVPQTGISDLQNASITRHTTAQTSHATYVARILVGGSNGIAPQATLYSTGYTNVSEFYSNAEWLISQGVNVINMSNGMSNSGQYDIVAQWVDHIACQHDIHFVKSAGNDSGSDKYITSPGMAYNAITVGGFNDNDSTSHSSHTRYSQSCFNEVATANRPEKPNLIASAQNILFGVNDEHSGTSYAAPQVTGVIAQLCSYQSALKTKQTAVGAMLHAGSNYKLEGVSNPPIKGDVFSSSVRIQGNTQISEFEGAGKLDAKGSRSVVVYGNYWSPTINTSGFPYTQTVYINTSSNDLTRVAIFWLKRNSISSSTHTSGNVSQTTFTDLDLFVYAPNGNLVGSSTTSYSNFEIVQFTPSQTGTYTIKITRTGSSTSTKEHVGIAVW